jgi:hypothetical protein
MVRITGKFDGKVIVPDEPLELAAGERVTVIIEPVSTDQSAAPTDPLDFLASKAQIDETAPADLATEVDHSLYGTPKRQGD